MEKQIKRTTLIIMSSCAAWLFILGFLSVTSLFAEDGYAQDPEEVVITVNYQNVTLTNALKDIESKTDFKFLYSKPQVQATPSHITIPVKTAAVWKILLDISKQTGVRFRQTGNNISVYCPPEEKPENVQTGSITGTVYDAETGEPMSGASVFIKGTTMGDATDIDGKYIINDVEASEYTLVARFVGYQRQEKRITVVAGETITIHFKLETMAGALDEIMVIGYGTSKRRFLTGSVENVNAKQIEQQAVNNVLLALQGRLTGVAIIRNDGRLGSDIEVQIRGINSLSSGRDPLFVVDGVPFQDSDALSNISPSNIESIEVLKDAAATAIYGSRGANGVVLVTTKRATDGKKGLTINYNMGYSSATKITPMLNTQQYLDIRRQALELAGITPDAVTAPDLIEWDQNAYRNWPEFIYGDVAARRDLQVRLSGGTGTVQYTVGGGHLYQEDLVSGGAVQNRTNAYANLRQTSDDNRFTSNVSIIYSYNEYKDNHLSAEGIQELPPNFPVYDDNGEYFWEEDLPPNPYAIREIDSKNGTHNFMGSVNARYEVLDGLSFSGLVSYNRTQTNGESLNPTSSLDPYGAYSTNHSTFSLSSYQVVNIEPQARYETVIGEGQLQALFGYTWMHRNDQNSSIRFEDYSSDILLRSWALSNTVGSRSSGSSEYKYQSLFSRINFNWDGRYIINLSGRRDGSSKFGPGRRWGNFAAVGVAWIFSSEEFISEWIPFLSFGKLRASYGVVGNDQIDGYGYLLTYEPGFFLSNFNGNSWLTPARLANPDYSWETTKKLDIALEFGFFNDRLRGSIGWFRNVSSDQLVSMPVAAQTGFTSFLGNSPALVENSGWEIELQWESIRNRNLSLMTSFNISKIHNELLEYPNLENSPHRYTYVIGAPLNRIFAYNFEGIDPATGRAKFTDFNEDGSLNTADFAKIGRYGPRNFGGINNSLSYKSWRLDVFVQFSQENVSNWRVGMGIPGRMTNVPTVILDNYWTLARHETELPSLNTLDQVERVYDDWFKISLSDAAYDDIWYTRLKTVSLSWSIPANFASKIGVDRARIYIRGQNLLTFTSKDIGKDPEINSLNSMPIFRTWTAGLQLSF